jgi:hypothetical protein
MSVLEKLLTPDIVVEAFKQLRERLFSNKLRQLVSGKPIEIYEGSTEIEIDTAKIQLQFKSYIENLINKRINRALDFLSFSYSSKSQDYKFQVSIRALLDFNNIRNFLMFNFSNKDFLLLEDKVSLNIKDFKLEEKSGKIYASVEFTSKYLHKYITINGNATLHASGTIKYDSKKFVVSTQDLDYHLETKNFIIKYIDYKYHKELLQALKGLLTVDIEEELFNAKVAAQELLNDYQSQRKWISGVIHTLDVDRLNIKPEGLRALFIAEGQLQLLP